MLTKMVSACIRRCCAFVCRREGFSGRAGDLFGVGGEMPGWLSLLHRVTTVAVLMALGLSLVLVGASIIVAACSCYERIVSFMQEWGGTSAAGS